MPAVAVLPSVPAQLPTEPWAVLAYAPEELVWADWLHRALNGALVPRKRVGQPTRHGFPLPETISVFPDPCDHEALAHYDDVLPHGRWLIVICSQHSAECEEMEGRIKAFKRAGGEERIVVLVVDSEDQELGHTTAGRCGREWLPVWLRWRLNDQGNFSAATEPGEPPILDARLGRLELDEARRQLLAILFEDPAASAAFVASATPAAPTAAAVAPAATEFEPARSRRSYAFAAGLAVALVPIAGWLAWSKTRPTTAAAPVAPATSLHGPFALGVSTRTETVPNVRLRPEPALDVAPAPAPALAVNVAPSAPEEQVKTAPVASEPPAEPTLPSSPAISASGSDTPGPVTALVDPSVGGPPLPPQVPELPSGSRTAFEKLPPYDAELDRWRKLRDLGDTLFDQGNRDAGIVALTQAAEGAFAYADQQGVHPTTQIEAARLCYRVAALLRYYGLPPETESCLGVARKILEEMPAPGELSTERDELLKSIGVLQNSLRPAAKQPAKKTAARR